MDINTAILNGRLAVEPEPAGPDGSIRLLVIVRTGDLTDSRVDVIPVHVPADVVTRALKYANPTERVWITGSIQRRTTRAGGTGITIVAAAAVIRTEEAAS